MKHDDILQVPLVDRPYVSLNADGSITTVIPGRLTRDGNPLAIPGYLLVADKPAELNTNRGDESDGE